MARATDYGRGCAPLALIVADPGPDTAEADAAMGLLQAQFRGRADWRSAGEGRLDHPGAIELIAIEAQHADDEMLAMALPRIADVLAESDARAVVALRPDQIDRVASAMMGPRVEMLCEPTLAERAAAFAVALSPLPRNRLREPGGDGASEQLRRLNEEVARISRILARLAKEEQPASAVADRKTGYDGPPTSDMPAIGAADVRRTIRARRLRDQFFGEGLFEDPAWDMLLDLYAADLERAQVSVSSLCIAAAVAPTTALRWIARMTEDGLFIRQPDPFDRRRAYLALSENARQKMDRYFTALRQNGQDPA